VNGIEQKLRDELRRLAELTQSDDLQPLRPPARAPRFHQAASRPVSSTARWLAPALAVAAVLVVVGAVALAGGLAKLKPARPGSGSPTAMPRFYVTTQGHARRWEIYVTATVHDSRTGAALATLPVWHHRGWQAKGQPPGTIQYPSALTEISVARNDRTFVISAGPGLTYMLRIPGSGRFATIQLIASRYAAGNPAVSPDGANVAAGLGPCFGQNPACAPSVGLEVTSLRTGAARTWSIRGATQGTVDPVWLDSSRVEFFIDRSWRILDIDAPGGSLLGDSRPTTTRPPAPLVTVMYSQKATGEGTHLNTMRVVRLSASTGKVAEDLYTYTQQLPRNPDPAKEGSCLVLSVAPSGQALIQCDRFGRLDGRRFTPLPGVPAAKALLNMWPAAPNAAW
jgi:hypothetical protein